MSAFLLALLVAQNADGLTLDADRPVLLRGVSFTLTITAPGVATGRVRLTGLRNMAYADLVNGQAVLHDVTPEGEVTATLGSATTRLNRRILPPWVCLIPPLLAIALAILTREVIVSLLLGIWSGLLILIGFGWEAIPRSAFRLVDTELPRALIEQDHIHLILFLLLLGGIIGLGTWSGGTKGLVDVLSKRVRSRRGGMLSTWGLALTLSFDDYADCLVVGNTMRPLTDRLRISREKLSYLVDSTAGPVAAIGLVSTWIVTEMHSIGGAVSRDDLFSIFLGMLPYSFYALFALGFVFLISLTGRDFGPMHRAETRAVTTGQVLRLGGRPFVDRDIGEVGHVEDLSDRWHNVVFPVLALLAFSGLLLYAGGIRNPARPPGDDAFWHILGYSDPERAPLWAALGATLVAFLCILARRHLAPRPAIEAWLRGCKAMFVPIVILVLAWTMSQVCRDLSLGRWTVEHVRGIVSPAWFPAGIFLVCAVTSFATGSSSGTIVLLFPLVFAVAWASPDAGIRYGSLAAVLSGALFGDHISPISDTTIVSSIASAADHFDHVKTQAPYAIAVALVALVGFTLAGHGVSPWIGLGIGAAGLVAAVFALGKKVPEVSDL